MKGRLRLTRSSDFQRLLSSGRLYSGPALVAFATRGTGDRSRVGVAVSRQLRGAVRRNRARRRLREVVRQRMLAPDSVLLRPGISYDVVLIARPAALSLPLAALAADAERALRQIRERR